MSKYDKCYRVIFNSASNDFNNELDYTIATYHLNKNNTKMKWIGNEQWFDIKDDVIYDRREAERELVKKCLGNYKKSNNQQSQLDQANERLKGAIVPKFKIGQEVYKVYTKDQRFPFKVKIIGVKITQTEEKISVLCDTEEDGIEMGWYPEKILFETLEEAEKKLQELRYGDFSGE